MIKMANSSWQILVSEILTLIIIFLIISFLIKEYKAMKYQRRFEKFSLMSTKDHEKSFFDIIEEYLLAKIKTWSKICAKIKILREYSNHYEKYNIKEEYENIDYISIKFLMSFIVLSITILTSIFSMRNIHFIEWIIALLIGFFIPDILLAIKFKKRQKKMPEDLLKSLIIINNELENDKNIMQAIEKVTKELDGAIKKEYQIIYLDLSYGLNIETVFQRFYNRVKIEEIKEIATTLAFLNNDPKNISQIFNKIEKDFYQNQKLKSKKTRIMRKSFIISLILIAIPPILSWIILLKKRNYYNGFFKTPYGFLLFLSVIVLYITYIVMLRKIQKERK